MKTFKAIRFQLVEDEAIKEYTLYDGVIINKENSGTGWLLEILIDEIHLETMETYMHNETILDTRIVITRASNDPAMFESTIKDIQKLRQTYAEKLLEQLVNEGLSGQALIKAFNRKMQSKPKLKDENE